MRSIGGSVRSVRSVCVKESKISVNKIFVLFVRFVFKKDIRGFLSKRSEIRVQKKIRAIRVQKNLDMWFIWEGGDTLETGRILMFFVYSLKFCFHLFSIGFASWSKILKEYSVTINLNF